MHSHHALVAALAIPFVTWLSSSPALACGGMIGSNEQHAAGMNAQRVLIAEGEASTAIVVSVGYEGADGDNAFVLPLQRAPAQVADADRAIFDELEQLTAPRISVIDRTARTPSGSGCGCAGGDKSAGAPGGAGRGEEVTVVQRGETETYQYVVVGGGSGASLQEWLSKEQFPVPAQLQASLDSYAKRDWLFLAARIRPTASAGSLAPIEIHYAKLPLEELEYPFALSAESVKEPARVEVLLYLAGARPFLPANYRAARIAAGVKAISPTRSNYDEVFTRMTETGAFVLESGMVNFRASFFAERSTAPPSPLATTAPRMFPKGIHLARLRGRLGHAQLVDMKFKSVAEAAIATSNDITVFWDPPTTSGAFGALFGLTLLRRRSRPERAKR
ncbi:MAG: DUF2330 domain-containing protein [Myxococcales bacterium]|nr:DUF2330 domain-containing protein [Myxococcales bacterium]